MRASEKKVDDLNQQAFAMRHIDTRQALALCTESSELAARLDYQYGLAHGLYLTSLCQFILGESKDVVEKVFQARAVMQSIDDLYGLAMVDNLLGHLYDQSGAYKNALDHHQRSLQTREKIGDLSGQSGSLNNIGLVYQALQQPVEAMEYLLKSLKIAEKTNLPEDLAYPLSNLGELFQELGQPDRALEYYQRGLAVAQQSTDRAIESTLLKNVGQMQAQLGNFEQAKQHLEESLKLCEQTGNLHDMGMTLLAMGQVYTLFDQYKPAGKALTKALKIMEQLQDPNICIKILYALANNLYKQGCPDQALPQLEKALKLAQETDGAPMVSQIYRLMAHTHERLGDYEQAFRHYRAYHHASLQDMNAQENEKRIQALTAKTEIEKAQQETESERSKSAQLAEALHAARQSDEQKEKLLKQLETQAAMLQQLAREDGLTGVANRRWLDLQLLREYERARRFNHPLSIAMLDIDNFKSINDRFTHITGDKVLRAIADRLKNRIRSVDIIGRYGGEEFMLIMLETTEAQASRVCENIRAEIETSSWKKYHPELETITISIGVAGLESASNLEELVTKADQQLYLSKQGGKNRVCTTC